MYNFIVYDNFLNTLDYNKTYNHMLHFTFDWHLVRTVLDQGIHSTTDNIAKQDKNILEYSQFYHDFILNKTVVDDKDKDIIDIFCKQFNVNVDKITRMKSNYKTKMPEVYRGKYNTPHIDGQNGYVGLFYLNDSDGPTYFFNEEQEIVGTVYPAKNRCVLFDGNILHAASHPVDSECRVVINFNIEK